ncbi:unnamed protein product [Paramecium pentaurelia]|uniref:Uncharacterized protein n=1 Tax=Paramecium pentaurelia TaxID=43138 RepID=A0A8S1T472_9CILI|nr:unnamed protein product [Paramecium pentaurelia]
MATKRNYKPEENVIRVTNSVQSSNYVRRAFWLFQGTSKGSLQTLRGRLVTVQVTRKLASLQIILRKTPTEQDRKNQDFMYIKMIIKELFPPEQIQTIKPERQRSPKGNRGKIDERKIAAIEKMIEIIEKKTEDMIRVKEITNKLANQKEGEELNNNNPEFLLNIILSINQ